MRLWSETMTTVTIPGTTEKVSYCLIDDGTLDTVVIFDGAEFRFSQDYAAEYRGDNGALNLDDLIDDNIWDLLDMIDNTL